MASLETAAKDWLSDPPWNKLFKTSFDVIEDQINRGLVALAAISLAVRFLANLPSGDLLCIVVGVESDELDMKTLSGPFHASLAAYAAQNPACHESLFVDEDHPWKVPGFIIYGPVIMMLQAILLIAIEKIWIVFPRLSQKLERFYKSVVEEALLGKDPDVAEDFTGGALDKEKVVRERQREEICGALRGSSLFYYLYVIKNALEIIFAILFIIFNMLWGLQSDDDVGHCDITMGQSVVTMQCRQKRFDFYITILWAFIILLSVHTLTSICSLIWSIEFFGLRRITSIINGLKKEDKGLIESSGSDFLFLFDLVAHSCGQPSTLRVLSYTAPTFAELCQPTLKKESFTENSLKLIWTPSPLKEFQGSKQITIQKYVATILPNYRHHMKTVSAEDREHQVEFSDLIGGTKEYIVTISAIIGDAKMKGVTRTTFLPPFPPGNLSCVTLDDKDKSGKSAIKIRWSRPKGDFDKYILKVSQMDGRKTSMSPVIKPKEKLIFPSTFPHILSPFSQINKRNTYKREKEQDEIWLGHDVDEYVKTGIKPGEKYKLELRSMTGNQTCLEEKVPSRQIITKPLPPPSDSYEIETYPDKLLLAWNQPSSDGSEGHSFLYGYRILVRTADSKLIKDKTVQRTKDLRMRLTLDGIIVSGTQYTVSLASVCRDLTDSPDSTDLMKVDYPEDSISSFIEKSVITPPLPPSNIRLETSAATSLKVSWTPPSYIPEQGELLYSVSIDPMSSSVRQAMSDYRTKEVTETQYQFSKLPEIKGTGERYRITIKTLLKLTTGESSSSRESLSEVFTTKPLPPENLVVTDQNHLKFTWQKSPSVSVKDYQLKIRMKKEGNENEKTFDAMIEDLSERVEGEKKGEIEYHLPESLRLEIGVEYKVNIYSLVRAGIERDAWIESGPLFETITKQYETETKDDNEQNSQIDEFDNPRPTKILLTRRKSAAALHIPPSKRLDSTIDGSNDGRYSRQSSVGYNNVG